MTFHTRGALQEQTPRFDFPMYYHDSTQIITPIKGAGLPGSSAALRRTPAAGRLLADRWPHTSVFTAHGDSWPLDMLIFFPLPAWLHRSMTSGPSCVRNRCFSRKPAKSLGPRRAHPSYPRRARTVKTLDPENISPTSSTPSSPAVSPPSPLPRLLRASRRSR